MKLPKVSIVIPAFNEAQNIAELLTVLCRQKAKGFVIDEIRVVSDGSFDHTVEQAKKIKDSRISIYDGKQQQGKIKRINQIIEDFHNDILVMYDADIVLKDDFVTQKLVQPFLDAPDTDIVFGKQLPLAPETFVERLAYFGFYWWEEAKDLLGDRSERYRVHGQIRAFSKKFLSVYRLPTTMTISEDSYSFYYAKTHNSKIYFQKESIVYFRLASQFNDYVKQMARFMKSPESMAVLFGADVVAKYESMNRNIKIQALLRRMLKEPIWITIPYILLQSYTKIYSKLYKNRKKWEIAVSSKKIVQAAFLFLLLQQLYSVG